MHPTPTLTADTEEKRVRLRIILWFTEMVGTNNRTFKRDPGCRRMRSCLAESGTGSLTTSEGCPLKGEEKKMESCSEVKGGEGSHLRSSVPVSGQMLLLLETLQTKKGQDSRSTCKKSYTRRKKKPPL